MQAPIEKILGIEDKTDEQLEKYEVVTVIQIVDGDTVKIERNGVTETVRLIEVDTPESVHLNKPVECFANEATEKIKSLIYEQENNLGFWENVCPLY